MKNFLYKEFKLCLAPVNYLFLFFTAMIIIPNYPCYVPFFYICLSSFFIFNNAELNKDIAYSMVLPITKKDIVKSRCIIIAANEIISMIFTIPFALLVTKVFKLENQAGIEANVAFYGLIMIVITVFHYIFLTKYYKKAEKPGLPFVFGSIAFWVIYLVLEFPIWTKNIFGIPVFQMLDSSDFDSQIKQLPVLGLGLLVYIAGWIITYKKSAANFEKVDL